MDTKLDIRHLRLIAAIAQEGGVTRAGKRLHLTQSAVSHQLRDAEEKLNTTLFVRLNKKMVLTPAGEKLLTAAQRILADLKHTEESIHGATTGALRLAMECYTCYHWLPNVLKRFHKKYPAIEVRICEDATRNVNAALLEGRLDLAIVATTPHHKGIRLEPLFDDEMFIVLPPRHRLTSKSFLRVEDLEGETVILYPPREESTLLNKFLNPAGIEPGAIMHMPLTEGILEMVHSGMGIGFLARWAIAPHVKTGKVVAKRLTRTGYRRQWSAATLMEAPLPAYLEQFVQLVQSSSMPAKTKLVVPEVKPNGHAIEMPKREIAVV
jgi:LysR family transcriptional regulator, regulator for metE and metH